MADNPLFYRSIVPLNRERHRDLRLKQDAARFGFSLGTHVIPAVVDEFAAAARHLPIVFMPAGAQPTPVFLLGMRPGVNLFVTPEGGWTGDYVPAFARRYPFMLGEVQGSDPVACIDEAYEGFNEAEGQRLFDETGTETAFLRDRVVLVNEYFQAAKRTERLSQLLNELQLLRPVTIESKHGGESTTLHGVLTVDEPKLSAMPEEDFLRLRKEGFLGPVYAHLLSIASVDKLRTPAKAEDPRIGLGAAAEAMGTA